MCPQYDYTCPACGATKEEIISLSEYDPDYMPFCPTCEANRSYEDDLIPQMSRKLSASPGKVFGYNAANGYN